MAKLHYVKKAIKDHKEEGIKEGESYYWWKFGYEPRKISRTKPPRKELTNSYYLKQLYIWQDEYQLNRETFDNDLAALIKEVEEFLEGLIQRRDKMPSQFYYTSKAGIILTERVRIIPKVIERLKAIDTSPMKSSFYMDKNFSPEEVERRKEEYYEIAKEKVLLALDLMEKA
jgi:hypothetical protein